MLAQASQAPEERHVQGARVRALPRPRSRVVRAPHGFHICSIAAARSTRIDRPRREDRRRRRRSRRAASAVRAAAVRVAPDLRSPTAPGSWSSASSASRSLRRARDGARSSSTSSSAQFESLLDDTLDDLYANKDPRAAIIAAYARMEQLFASSRLAARAGTRRRSSTSAGALGELRASGAALGRLTGLFQRAKFSAHEVDESMRDEAIEALTQVRDELRAKRLEEELRHAEQAAARSRRKAHDQLGDARRRRGSVRRGGGEGARRASTAAAAVEPLALVRLVCVVVVALSRSRSSRSSSRAGGTSRSTSSSSSSARSAWRRRCARRTARAPTSTSRRSSDELADPLDVLPAAAGRAGAARARGPSLARELVLPAPPPAAAAARDRVEPPARCGTASISTGARTRRRSSSAPQAWEWLRPDRPEPRDRWAPGPPFAELTAVVDALERI